MKRPLLPARAHCAHRILQAVALPGLVTWGAVLTLGLLSPLALDASTLVKDVNSAGDPTAGLLHSGVYLVDGTLVFTGDDGLAGREIWISDGTAVGTERLGDLPLEPGNYVEMGGDLYFTSYDQETGCEIWTADLLTGTATVLTDLNAAAGSACPLSLTATTSHVYFLSTGSNVVDAVGTEIWRTNGTVGAETVHELIVGPDSGSVASFTPVGDDLYFVGDDGVHGSELWRVTSAGSVQRVDAIDDGGGPVVETHATPTALYAVSDTVIAFSAVGGDGRELYRFNGSDTVQIADIATGTAWSSPQHLFRHGALVYFAADDGTHGREAWATDGSTVTRISDIHVGGGDANPEHFVSIGSTVYFFATDGSEVELWSTDGTLGGTARVRNFVGMSLSRIEVHGASTQFYFLHDKESGDEPIELWRSDGTGGGTVLLATFENYWRNTSAVIGDEIFFAGTTAADGRELWKSDGNWLGDERITDHAEPGSAPDDLHVLGDGVVFTAYEPATGRELWSSDGTAAGTTLRVDGDPVGNGFPFLDGAASHGFFYYRGEDPSLGEELFRVDQTSHELAFDLVAGAADGSPADFYGTADRLHFSAYDDQGLWELRSTDGSTVERLDPNPAGDDDSYDLFEHDGWTWFSGLTEHDGKELFRTDGTAAGTSLIADVEPGAGSSRPEDFASRLGLLFFSADTADGREPWISDGTSGGTEQLLDVRPGPDSSSPSDFAEAQGLVFFVARNASGVDSLFVTDGTGPGTQQLLEDVDSNLVPVSGGVVFAFDDPALGRELYFSDGSSAELLADVFPGTPGSDPSWLTGFDGLAYFTADDGTHGEEIWVSDGTADGTRLLHDVRPGPGGSDPEELTPAIERLFFVANDGATGRELHAVSRVLFADGFESGDLATWQ